LNQGAVRRLGCAGTTLRLWRHGLGSLQSGYVPSNRVRNHCKTAGNLL